MAWFTLARKCHEISRCGYGQMQGVQGLQLTARLYWKSRRMGSDHNWSSLSRFGGTEEGSPLRSNLIKKVAKKSRFPSGWPIPPSRDRLFEGPKDFIKVLFAWSKTTKKSRPNRNLSEQPQKFRKNINSSRFPGLKQYVFLIEISSSASRRQILSWPFFKT